MNKSQMSVEDILYQSGLRINNSINDPDILTAVSVYNYNADKLAVGKAVLNEAENLAIAFTKEHSDVDQALADRNEQQDKANTTYVKFYTVAKIAMKGNYAAINTLQLTGRKSVRLSKWLVQTKNFYNNLLANSTWLALMLTYGMDEEMIELGLEEVENVESYAENIMREKGDAQQSTVDRDEKIDELYEWVSDYEEIAKIALSDKPQLLEKLGIVV